MGLIAVVAGAAAGGCADDSSKTDLPDISAMVQVMVSVSDLASADYLTDPASGFAITYELNNLIPIGGNSSALSDYDNCFLFDPATDGSPSPECRRADTVADCMCPSFIDGTLTCASSGPLIGRCVDSGGNIPEARHANPFPATIRLVVGKLLDGATLEHFACACQGDALVTDDPTVKDNLLNLSPDNCAGQAWSDDPLNCAVCSSGVRTATGYETHCFDSDSNGLPDKSSLIPGVATLTCTAPSCPTDAGWTGSGGTCTYVTQEGDGYFYPSGNQFQSSVTGLSGVGPAIVIAPANPLPVSSDCTITVADSVKFDSGEGLTAPTDAPKFHTEDLELSLTTADTENINGSPNLIVTFSTSVPLSAADVHVEVTDVNSTAFDVTDVNATPDFSDNTNIEVTFTNVTLTANHIFTYTLTGTTTDLFGNMANIDVDATNITAVVKATSKR